MQAEGDYVRIHSGELSWLLHTTMAAMGERLDAGQFRRLHRSSIVQKLFIARLLHREGRWFAELSDGSTQRIAKSHAPATLRAMNACSSASKAVSPKLRPVPEASDGFGKSDLTLVPWSKDTVSAL